MGRLLSSCKLISSLLDTKDAEVVKEALCYRPVTRRGYPYLCKLPQRSDLYLTAGHGPWGISLGPGTGKVMSELVLNGKATSADISRLGL
jgi:glycine/D-amino acid oxidase-like deaminating enzyme